MTVSPILAVQIWDFLALGVAVDWQIQRIKVNGLENFANPLFSSHPRRVTDNGYSYSHGVTATIGARTQIFGIGWP